MTSSSPEENPALFRNVKAGEAAEQRRLAAAAGAQEKEELTRLDGEVEPLQGDH